MSRGLDALGSDTSLGLRAEVPPDPRFLNEGKQEEDKRGTGGPPEGGSLLWEPSTLLEDRRQCLERGGSGQLWQPGFHSRHQRGR